QSPRLRLRPGFKVHSIHLIHHQVPRWFIERDFLKLNEMWVAPDAILKKTKQRQLAFQRSRFVFRITKFEYAGFVQLVVPAQPNLASAAYADLRNQTPLGPRYDRVGGGGPGGWCRRAAVHIS